MANGTSIMPKIHWFLKARPATSKAMPKPSSLACNVKIQNFEIPLG